MNTITRTAAARAAQLLEAALREELHEAWKQVLSAPGFWQIHPTIQQRIWNERLAPIFEKFSSEAVMQPFFDAAKAEEAQGD